MCSLCASSCILFKLCSEISISSMIQGLLSVKMPFSGTGIHQDGKSHNCDNWSLSKIYKWLVSSQQIEVPNMPQLYLPREWLRKQQRIQRERFGEHKLTCTNRILHLEILPFASHKLKPISLPSHPQIPHGGLPVNFQQIRSVSPSHVMPFLLELICSIWYPLGLRENSICWESLLKLYLNMKLIPFDAKLKFDLWAFHTHIKNNCHENSGHRQTGLWGKRRAIRVYEVTLREK